jgi:uncharacterized membrane protein YozB (DUF420 family)
MSLLNNSFALVATLSLALQIVVLILLFYGYNLNRKRLFPQHGRIMAWAVFLHLVMIFVIMVPAFVLALIPEFIVPHVSEFISAVTLIHVLLGVTAVSLGLWFVVAWRFKGLKGCFNRKRLMLITMIAWVSSLLFGIALYMILYYAALMG